MEGCTPDMNLIVALIGPSYALQTNMKFNFLILKAYTRKSYGRKNRYITKYILVQMQKRTILVTSRGGLYGCEMPRIPDCLDNRFTHGRQVVSLKRQPCFTPKKISCTHFC
jgi:hypothetical protein